MISYGSRPKTHARLLVSFSIRVTSADMDVPLCFLLQWRKGDSAGARKGAKGSR